MMVNNLHTPIFKTAEPFMRLIRVGNIENVSAHAEVVGRRKNQIYLIVKLSN